MGIYIYIYIYMFKLDDDLGANIGIILINVMMRMVLIIRREDRWRLSSYSNSIIWCNISFF